MQHVQASFKRTSTGTNTPAALLVSQSRDWDTVKPEDKTLVHQVNPAGCPC